MRAPASPAIHEALRLCYGLVIRGRRHAPQRRAAHMMPNFKIVICGVIGFILLFAVTGAGIVTPQTYTRIGEMPEVSRPLMQQVIVYVPGLAQFQSLNATRRGEE